MEAMAWLVEQRNHPTVDQQYQMQIAMLVDSIVPRIFGRTYQGKLQDKKLVWRTEEDDDPQSLEERKRVFSQMMLARWRAVAEGGGKRARSRTDGRTIAG